MPEPGDSPLDSRDADAPDLAQSGMPQIIAPPPSPQRGFDWRGELSGLILVLIAVFAFNSVIAKQFYIPSASMAPNLWVGDRLVVSKYPFGWNWTSPFFHVLPRGSWRIWPHTPEYGDIVITVPRGGREDYIKRVVALPGDRIAVVNGQIVLNGHRVPQAVEPPAEVPLSALGSAEDPDPCAGPGYEGMQQRTPAGQTVCVMPVFRETLPNGATYLIVDHLDEPLDHFAEVRVPPGHVFLMGDNRDHSADSRVPLDERGLGGPVAISDIGGRAEFLTFSLDGDFLQSEQAWNPIAWWRALRAHRGWRSLRPAIAISPAGAPRP